MNIVLAEPLNIDRAYLERLAEPLKSAGHTFTAYDTKPASGMDMGERLKDADIGIIANSPFPDEAVRLCGKMRFLQVAFTGLDHVGLDACRDLGIEVKNAAGYSDEAVAELAVGMTIDLLRRLQACDAAVRAQKTSAGLMGTEIGGKTVGIVGTGHIGLRTAEIFKAFGAKLIAFSRTVREEGKKLGITYLPLERVMAEADIVTLHIPNNASTKGMIGKEQIALMKKTAILINCARGPVLDGAALAEALNENRIAGAGIDVYDREPPLNENEPLLHAKNTLLTPHIGFLSTEAMQRRAEIVFRNVLDYTKACLR